MFDDNLFEEYNKSLGEVTKTYNDAKSRFDLNMIDYNRELAIKTAREEEANVARLEKEFTDREAKRNTDMATAEAARDTL
jgi:hypothetical protein